MKKTILVVDDDIDYLFQIKVKIQQFGFEVITAESQREGEKILETFRPDLVLCDLMMEREDSGFILSYKIKKKYPDVPVILATAVTAETGISFNANQNSSKSWIKADLILDKGIRSDQLEKEIKKLLKM
ncbi:MAG TPA: response regulator [Bacteroidales bacterium]|nr:response regulator [Bacteroidales bacterium]HPR56981.1 response regulator [Bacteroidales bacterium]HRW97542.1 response regulator [Bacteroidales bacterium]